MAVSFDKVKKPTGATNKVIAIDPSTKCGIIVLDLDTGETIHYDQWVSKPDQGRTHPMERVAYYSGQLDDLITRHQPLFVIIENYGFTPKQGKDTIVLTCHIGHALRDNIWENKVPYLEVPPNNLKKFVLGKGQGGKDEMRLGVFKRWGVEFKTDDQCDAYGLAQMARSLYTGEVASKAQAESLRFLLDDSLAVNHSLPALPPGITNFLQSIAK